MTTTLPTTLHYSPQGYATICNLPIATVSWTPRAKHAALAAHPCPVCQPVAQRDHEGKA